MNIADTVHTLIGTAQTGQTEQYTPDTSGSATVHATPETAEDRYIPGDTSAGLRTGVNAQDNEPQAEERPRDEFVQTPVVSHNALYNVSDVQKDRNGRIIRAGSMTPSPMRGQQVSDKIADIILSLGRKSLSIFRLDA